MRAALGGDLARLLPGDDADVGPADGGSGIPTEGCPVGRGTACDGRHRRIRRRSSRPPSPCRGDRAGSRRARALESVSAAAESRRRSTTAEARSPLATRRRRRRGRAPDRSCRRSRHMRVTRGQHADVLDLEMRCPCQRIEAPTASPTGPRRARSNAVRSAVVMPIAPTNDDLVVEQRVPAGDDAFRWTIVRPVQLDGDVDRRPTRLPASRTPATPEITPSRFDHSQRGGHAIVEA